MKAVIVDVLDGNAAALRDDGRVVKIPDAGYALGQIIELYERSRPRWLRVVSSVVAAAVLLMGIGGAAYAMPYGVVTLDADPSISYTINCFDYVLSVEGINDDGKAFLAGMDRRRLVHHHIDAAVAASLDQLEADKYLGESGEILLAAGSRKDGHTRRLIEGLEAEVRRNRQVELIAFAVSPEEIDEARREGMSAGRRRLLEEMGEGRSDENWAERPVGELLWEYANGSQPKPGNGNPNLLVPPAHENQHQNGDTELPAVPGPMQASKPEPDLSGRGQMTPEEDSGLTENAAPEEPVFRENGPSPFGDMAPMPGGPDGMGTARGGFGGGHGPG